MSVETAQITGQLQRRRARVAGVWLDALTEDEVIDTVRDAWVSGRGGSIVTVNVDVARAAARDPALAELIASGSLVLADGMPLVWASRAGGQVLPERVAGSSLIFTLSAEAAVAGRSVFLLGGEPGVPEKAAEALALSNAGLHIAGTASPPFGFEQTDAGLRDAVSAVVAAEPDLVFVGLGFPKQERLITLLRPALPATWFVACGAAIPMAAGVFRRASPVIQALGLEWAHRLRLEPRRLAHRYLRNDLPFALAMMTEAVIYRVRPHDHRSKSARHVLRRSGSSQKAEL